MKNIEKYAEKIKNYNGDSFCDDFIEPKALKPIGKKCGGLTCNHCHIL